MNYGLHLSASGALSNLYRMDVLANNLANSTTTAFKPDLPLLRQRDAARVEDGLGWMPSNQLLERLGGGVTPIGNRVAFTQGALQSTANPFDLAIEGEGFFVVRERTNDGADELRLTRDGRFTRDSRGWLVTMTGGKPVMGGNNRPIQIPGDGPIQVQADGTVRQQDATLGHIQVTSVPQQHRLVKVGQGMFQAPSEAMESRIRATGVVRQGAIESSAVDAIAAMMGVTDAGRAAEANFAMIQSHDRVMDRAINGLGRVSA
jgi:flagellar basal-body rod protein FlgF